MRCLPLALALVACTDSGTIQIDDTDVDDTDVDGPAITGTVDATADVALPGAPVTVVLQHVWWPPEGSDEDPVLGDVLASDALGALEDGPQDYVLPLPDGVDDVYYQSTESSVEDEEVAFFMLGAFVDDDENGRPDNGETMVAATVTYVAHLRNGVSPDVQDIGAENGWNQITFDFLDEADDVWVDEAIPIPEGAAMDLDANLLPVIHDAPLRFSIAPALDAEVNVDLQAIGEDLDPADPHLITAEDVDASAAGATGTFPPLPDPDGDHVGLSEIGTDIALYIAFAYQDLNNSGTLEIPGDLPRAMSASGDQPRVVFHLHATDFFAAVWTDVLGFDMGHNVVPLEENDDIGEPMDWSEGLFLDEFE